MNTVCLQTGDIRLAEVLVEDECIWFYNFNNETITVLKITILAPSTVIYKAGCSLLDAQAVKQFKIPNI
jgi:hypothetical protein